MLTHVSIPTSPTPDQWVRLLILAQSSSAIMARYAFLLSLQNLAPFEPRIEDDDIFRFYNLSPLE